MEWHTNTYTTPRPKIKNKQKTKDTTPQAQTNKTKKKQQSQPNESSVPFLPPHSPINKNNLGTTLPNQLQHINNHKTIPTTPRKHNPLYKQTTTNTNTQHNNTTLMWFRFVSFWLRFVEVDADGWNARNEWWMRDVRGGQVCL